jgi:cytosine/adenosine deaminase-related metal-dependent hydrolase
VAVTPEQIARLGALGVSVVWCPASNLRLYGRTAPVPQLAGRVRLALGTDSTLSGSPTLLHELAVARGTGLATPAELLAMVTTGAAGIFRLADGRGTLRPGAPADLVLLPRRGAGAADALLAATPADVALVLVGGAPRLADPVRAAALGLGEPAARVAGRPTWLAGDLAALRRRIARAAGEAALAGSPTWALLEAAA